MAELQEAVATRLAKIINDELSADTAASWLVVTRRYNAPAAEKVCLSFIQEHGEEVLMNEMMQNGGPRLDPETCKALVEAATRNKKAAVSAREPSTADDFKVV